MWAYLVLPMAALLTSAVSGMVGMAGGMLLLAVLLCFLTHAETIPTHAAVQLASNSTRLIAFAGRIDWRTLGRFLIGVLPGAILGGAVYVRFGTPASSEPYLKMGVGLYVLTVTFLPKPRKRENRSGEYEFMLIGFVAGAAALTVGAVGPIIAPVFARCGFVKERLVATKAACQAVLHVVKIPFFIVAGSMGKFASFEVGRIGLLVIAMAVMVIPGTLIGKRFLGVMSESQFRRLYQFALVIAGSKVLLYDGVYKLIVSD